MNIAPVSFSRPVYKINKVNNVDSSNLSFKGDINDNNKKPEPISSHIFFYSYYNPDDALKKQMIADGYSSELIDEFRIFDRDSINPDFDINNPHLLSEVEEGRITKDDIFLRKHKTGKDIYTMEKAYQVLKEKFDSPDVRETVEMNKKVGQIFQAMTGIKDESKVEDIEYKRLLLWTLYNVDSTNLKLLNLLLDDENFDNVCISNALMKLDKNKDMTYGEQTLKMAQKIGYDKEFSDSLAILISEATEENMPMIQKMLFEQEFLIKNNDFVCEKLIRFLRSPDSNIAEWYVKSDNITLDIIQDCLQ